MRFAYPPYNAEEARQVGYQSTSPLVNDSLGMDAMTAVRSSPPPVSAIFNVAYPVGGYPPDCSPHAATRNAGNGGADHPGLRTLHPG